MPDFQRFLNGIIIYSFQSAKISDLSRSYILNAQCENDQAECIEHSRVYRKGSPEPRSPEHKPQRNRCDRLCGHARRIIISRKLADAGIGTEFDHHGEGAAVDQRHAISFDDP